MKPKNHPYSEGRNMHEASQPQRSSLYKPRDEMNKRRSFLNCGSADHHVADCTTYKQGMKSQGYAPDGEDMSQTEEYAQSASSVIKRAISVCTVRCFGRRRRTKIILNRS